MTAAKSSFFGLTLQKNGATVNGVRVVDRGSTGKLPSHCSTKLQPAGKDFQSSLQDISDLFAKPVQQRFERMQRKSFFKIGMGS